MMTEWQAYLYERLYWGLPWPFKLALVVKL